MVARMNRSDLRAEDLEEVKEAFEIFDADRDGYIDYRELKVALRALNFTVSKEEVKKLVAEYGRDGNEAISYDDFKDIVVEKMLERDPAEELSTAFQLFDKDSTGKISLKNLLKIARELGEDIDENELMDMIREFDTDGDGEIDEKEFSAIMKHF